MNRKHRPGPLRRGAALAVAALGLAVPVLSAPRPAHAHSEHAQQSAAAHPPTAASVRLEFRDTSLVDQDGKPVRFTSQVLGDRLVVMDFVYTSCTTVCPVVSAILAQVQERLGARLGKEVALVTVSVDPQRDTPARMKAYAARHGARSGWTWLTGTPGGIAEVLKGSGTYTANFEDHPAVILVGDPRSGQWNRYYGFADPKDLLARIDALAAARRGAANGATGAAATLRKE